MADDGWGSGWDNQAVAFVLALIIASGIPGSGLFEYSGTAAAGNPPILWAVAPGVTADVYGNTLAVSGGLAVARYAGATVQQLVWLDPNTGALKLGAGPPTATYTMGNIEVFNSAAFTLFIESPFDTIAAPFPVQMQMISGLTAGKAQFLLSQGGATSATAALMELQGSFAVGTTHGRTIWLPPSGDTSGATDYANITAALSVAQNVILLPGVFWINQPIVINSSYQVLQGAGMPFATTIASAFTSGQPEMILVSGASAPLNQVTVRDLALKGNGSTGHGLVFRSNNGLVENVIVQGNGLTGDCFHMALDSLPATGVFDVTMKNCYAMQPGSASGTGYLFDSNFNSCELTTCRAIGGTSAASKAAAWGFQLLGSELKLIACHADLFLNGGGALLSGAGVHQVIGGEYETNTGPGIEVATINCRVIGASMYVNTGPDIKEIAGANSNVYYGNSLASGTGVIVVGPHSVWRDNPGYNPVGHLTAPTYTAGSASTNTFGVPVTVFVSGSTAVSINGTATGLASGTFPLQPGETITPTGAGGSWTWFGE